MLVILPYKVADINMRILLATGIFYPDVGGPAIHVRKIAERLSAEGMQVKVLAYGDGPIDVGLPFTVKRISRKSPKAFQWALYMIEALIEGFRVDVIYAFDPTAAGLPACLASIISRKPFLIRIGGDPIWERVVEKGKRFMSLDRYYREDLARADKPFLYRLIRMVLRHAQIIVVYNDLFRDFYVRYYQIPTGKISVIPNPVFVREQASTSLPEDPIILFAGRLVKYKNLLLVLKAFDAVRSQSGQGRLMIVGNGPEKESLRILSETLTHPKSVVFRDSVDQEQLFGLIRASAVCIAPALSEFNPNFILEALSFGKPVLISKGHGLSVRLPDEFTFDPSDQDDLEAKMRRFLDPAEYSRMVEIIRRLPLNRSWDSVTSAHLGLIRNLITSVKI